MFISSPDDIRPCSVEVLMLRKLVSLHEIPNNPRLLQCHDAQKTREDSTESGHASTTSNTGLEGVHSPSYKNDGTNGRGPYENISSGVGSNMAAIHKHGSQKLGAISWVHREEDIESKKHKVQLNRQEGDIRKQVQHKVIVFKQRCVSPFGIEGVDNNSHTTDSFTRETAFVGLHVEIPRCNRFIASRRHVDKTHDSNC